MIQQGGNAVDARDRRRGHDDPGRAVQQRPRLRRVLHPLGRQAPARPERLRPGAARLDARVLPPQARRATRRGRRCAAGTRSPCPARSPSWVALSERFGKLPFADLLAPAIEIAERGYAVPIVVQQKWEAAAPLLKAQPGWAEAFLPHGRVPEVGERFAFPGRRAAAAARSPQTRGAALYGGEIAAAIAAHAAANGGAMTRRRPRRLPARVGRPDRHRRLRPPPARDPAERAGHRRADRARHPAPLRPRLAPGRRRRVAAPADRGDEARLRRRLRARRRRRRRCV